MILKNAVSKTPFLFLVVICFYLTCSYSGAAPGLSPDNAGQNSARILSEITPAGWRMMAAAERFDPQNLWQRINGYAEFFLSYDMVQMIFAAYADPSDDETFIEASIYDMGNPANAFGVFGAERQNDFSPLDLGREAYRSDASLFIWKGQYYVRMIASRDDPGVRRINLDLAKKLIRSLSDTGEPVWGLKALPPAGRVPGSVRFYRRDAMGLDFLENTYTAQYSRNGTLITVFLLKTEDTAAAEKIMDRYTAYAKQFGKGVKSVVRENNVFRLCDMDGSYDVLTRHNGLIAGVTSVKDRNAALDVAAEIRRLLTANAP